MALTRPLLSWLWSPGVKSPPARERNPPWTGTRPQARRNCAGKGRQPLPSPHEEEGRSSPLLLPPLLLTVPKWCYRHTVSHHIACAVKIQRKTPDLIHSLTRVVLLYRFERARGSSGGVLGCLLAAPTPVCPRPWKALRWWRTSSFSPIASDKSASSTVLRFASALAQLRFSSSSSVLRLRSVTFSSRQLLGALIPEAKSRGAIYLRWPWCPF